MVVLFGLAACLGGCGPVAAARGVTAERSVPADFSVLVFSRTIGFRHDSIVDGVAAIRTLGARAGFAVDWTEDPGTFTEENLSRYHAVVFLSTTGDVLDRSQEGAFERYVQAGGGYVGIHAAADTEYDWPWYGGLVGVYFKAHPAIQAAVLNVEDYGHLSTASLPESWQRIDEWYDFQTNPQDNARVLLRLDETSYVGGTMGSDHPISWYHNYDGGRAWYTAGGHTTESFTEPLFLDHLLGGILYAAGKEPSWAKDEMSTGVGALAVPGSVALFDGQGAEAWVSADRRQPSLWPVVDGALQVCAGCGDIRSVGTFQDFRLHLEFWLPGTPPDVGEQERANSGVYLQGCGMPR